MLSKVEDRRANGRADYSPDSLTDTVGIRIITHYRDEIPDVVRRLFLLILAKPGTGATYLSEGHLVEFLEYVPHLPAENDPFTGELREIYTTAYEGNPPSKFEPKPRGGYSSVHMVLRFPTPAIPDACIGVEIQIRSVFEDVWGQIDHKLAYEQERRTGDSDPAQRESLKRHLSVLKNILDSAANYADAIKSTFVSPQSQQMHVTRSLDGSDYVHALCGTAKIGASLEARITDLMREKRRLDQEIAAGTDLDGSSDYIALADEFSNISASDFDATLSSELSVTTARSSLRIILLLEGALCRFLSEDRQQVRLAVAQYRAIAKEQPDNPICWFRQGQALAFLAIEAVPGSDAATALVNELDHAYGQARAAIDKFGSGASPRDVHLSNHERTFIQSNVSKLHGFALWRVSDVKRRALPTTEADIMRVVRAYEISVVGIELAPNSESRIRLVNNALYFACDAHESASRAKLELSYLPDKAKLPALLEELSKYCDSREDGPIGFWDTIVHAAVLLELPEQGRESASKVLDVNTQILTPVSEFGSAYAVEMRNRAVQFAWRVYREA